MLAQAVRDGFITLLNALF